MSPFCRDKKNGRNPEVTDRKAGSPTREAEEKDPGNEIGEKNILVQVNNIEARRYFIAGTKVWSATRVSMRVQRW